MDTWVKSYDTGMNMEILPQTYVTEDKFITPFVKVLENVGPQRVKREVTPQDVTASLDALFPEQQHQDKDIQKAKQVLGELAKNFTDAELKDLLCEVKFLVENWLDNFERDSFNGLTLAELLHERGGI